MKIVILFSSAVLSFLVLSYVDEYENLITPLFRESNNGYVELFDPAEDESRMKKFLVYYNDALSSAYRTSDPSRVSGLPMSGSLRSEIAEEIQFLSGSGRTMDVVVRDIDIIKIERSSQAAMKVHAREKVGLRYLRGDDPEASGPYKETENTVTYFLTIGPMGFEISSYDVTFVKDIG